MGKVIIAIHGLGNKPSKELLHKWGKMAIEEGLKQRGVKVELPPVEIVYWADLFYDQPQSLAEKDKNSPRYLAEVYIKAPKHYKVEKHEYRKMFSQLAKEFIYRIFLKKDYHLRYAFVSQKLLHKYFHELDVYLTGDNTLDSGFNKPVKDEIVHRLSAVLQKHAGDDIMLVSHSMGTIIAFDVLSFVTKDIDVDTFVTMGSPLGAPFVISRIAQHYKKTYGLLKLQTPESVRRQWYNFSDIEDMIALDYKLSDDFAPNSKGVRCVDVLVKNNYVMNGVANPHKSYGYLRTPQFTEVLLNFLNHK